MTLAIQGQLMQQKAVRGLAEQARAVSDLLSSLASDDFERTPPGRARSVKALVGSMIVGESSLLSALTSPTNARPVPLDDCVQGERMGRHRRDELAEELAVHETSRALVDQFRQHLDEILLALDEPGVPSVVRSGRQTVRTLDLLRSMTVELLLVSGDLEAALPGRPLTWSRDALATGSRALTEMLAHRHPGRSIEVRVPPFAAVQCGQGDDPTHTRGTPPNVVELDARTLLRLTNGRSAFADEVARGAVAASGTRSDLSEWFPLLRG